MSVLRLADDRGGAVPLDNLSCEVERKMISSAHAVMVLELADIKSGGAGAWCSLRYPDSNMDAQNSLTKKADYRSSCHTCCTDLHSFGDAKQYISSFWSPMKGVGGGARR